MADGFRYTIYGLRLQSDIALPAPQDLSVEAPDVVVRLADSLTPRAFPHRIYATAATTAAGAPYLAVDATDGDEPAILMRQTSDHGVIDFLLQSPGEVSIHLRGRVEPSDLRAYFMGPVLGHLLRLRRTTALHGGFVHAPGGAVGVVGPKGAGKSSLTAAWALAGVPVLADDIGALAEAGDGRWRVAPGYPRLRLWPDTARELGFPISDPAERVMSFGEKVYVDLGREPLSFEAAPQRLRAILVLGPRGGDSAGLERLARGPAIAMLMANVYAPTAGGAAARRCDMAAIDSLCRSIPVYRASLPASFPWLRQQSLALLESLTR